ncbi:MAG TPA: hypothetical protein VJI32_04840, partial [Candidatus Nanoarchaeia archaeon]|nr:hypothetical protein [Candidatus Nanoarchaeia archaeon]
IDISSCTTALQCLDTVGKALGTPLGNFSILNRYLQQHYYPNIILVGMKEFGERCPHATKELETILKRVKDHFHKQGKEFEYQI